MIWRPVLPFTLAQSPPTTRTIHERIASIEQAPEPGDAATGRRYKAVMMTGEVVTDFHTGRTRYAHQLDRNGTIHLDRMNSGRAPVVDNHSMWGSGGESVLGVVEQGTVKMTAAGLVGTLRFQPDDQLPEGIRNGLASGVLQNLSIQVTVLGMERLESDGLVLAKVTEYDPFEVSVVPVGADSGAHMMRIAQSIHGFTAPLFDADGGGGDAAAGAGVPAAAAAAVTPTADEIRVAERARVTGIQAICQAVGLDPQPWIDSGQSVDDVRQAIRQRFTGAGDLFRPLEAVGEATIAQHFPGGAPGARLHLAHATSPDEQAIVRTERDRIAAVREICQSPLASDADPQPYIDGGQTADQVRADIWNRSTGGGGETTPDDPTGSDAPRFSQASTPRGGSAEEKMVVGIQHAFLERGDPDGIVARHEKLTLESGEYRGITMPEAGRILMGREGQRVAGYGANVAQSILQHAAARRQWIGIPGLGPNSTPDGAQVLGAQASIRQAFGGVTGNLVGAQGPADLSVVVQDLMNRSLNAAYALEGELMTWQACCKTGMNNDFRPQNHIMLGAVPDFSTRGPSGDFARAEIPNPENATTQVIERGQTMVVDRTTIINDDLGIVFRTPQAAGRGRAAVDRAHVLRDTRGELEPRSAGLELRGGGGPVQRDARQPGHRGGGHGDGHQRHADEHGEPEGRRGRRGEPGRDRRVQHLWELRARHPADEPRAEVGPDGHQGQREGTRDRQPEHAEGDVQDDPGVADRRRALLQHLHLGLRHRHDGRHEREPDLRLVLWRAGAVHVHVRDQRWARHGLARGDRRRG